MKPIVLLGIGVHSRVVEDIIETIGMYKIIARLDNKYTNKLEFDWGITGPISLAKELAKQDENISFFISIGNNIHRKKIFEQLEIPLQRYETFIHPSVVIGSNTKIGNGTVIMPRTVINTGTNIGNHVILNTASVIEHDCFIEDYVHISSNAALAGRVHVGEGTQIGIGANCIPKQTIGCWSMIGAGAAVTTNIPANCTAVGVPAKPIKFHSIT